MQLANLVSVKETVAPKELNHFNRLRAAIISVNVGLGYSLGQALDFLESSASEILPPTARTDLDGQSRESSTTLYAAFALALVFIYLVLSAQFESFIDPLIISSLFITDSVDRIGSLLGYRCQRIATSISSP